MEGSALTARGLLRRPMWPRHLFAAASLNLSKLCLEDFSAACVPCFYLPWGLNDPQNVNSHGANYG